VDTGKDTETPENVRGNARMPMSVLPAASGRDSALKIDQGLEIL
jgi:hypothetical protein